MNVVFYLSSAVAVACAVAAITRLNAVHALLYLILSLFAIAIVFYTIGAQFAAAIEVIINAGAIMVLFVFVAMILNQGPQTVAQERGWMSLWSWIPAVVLAAALAAELIYVVASGGGESGQIQVIAPKAVGVSLFTTYLLGVELASVLLLAGLIGAYHVGLRTLVVPAAAPVQPVAVPASPRPGPDGGGAGELVGTGPAAGAGRSEP